MKLNNFASLVKLVNGYLRTVLFLTKPVGEYCGLDVTGLQNVPDIDSILVSFSPLTPWDILYVAMKVGMYIHK